MNNIVYLQLCFVDVFKVQCLAFSYTDAGIRYREGSVRLPWEVGLPECTTPSISGSQGTTPFDVGRGRNQKKCRNSASHGRDWVQLCVLLMALNVFVCAG